MTDWKPVGLARGFCFCSMVCMQDLIAIRDFVRNNRDVVVDACRQNSRQQFQVPDGAFCLFFAIDGMTDSLATCLPIIDEARGEGLPRMCYLKNADTLQEGLDRFGDWMKKGNVV